MIGWPSRFFRWMPEAFENWNVKTEIVEHSDDSVMVRRKWLKRYIDVLGYYLLRLMARVLETGVKVILLDESWVGVGLSAATFNEYILPFDT